MASVCPHFLRGSCKYGSQCRQSHDGRSAAQTRPPPVRIPVKAPNQVLVCTFFQEGRCNRGKTCSFSHSNTPTQRAPKSPPATAKGSATVSSPSLPSAQNESPVNFLREPCKFFMKGVCKNGTHCTFPHPASVPIVDRSFPSPDSVTIFPSNIPCKFHSQGRCSKGEECSFLHSQPASKDGDAVSDIQTAAHAKLSNQALLPTAPTQEDEADFLNQDHAPHTRSMQRCEVYFGAGASVTQIKTAFESSHVVLSNLPKSLTQDDMPALLRPLDGLVKYVVYEATSTATLEFADCTQAAKAVRHFDDLSYRGKKLAARLILRGVENVSGTLLSRRVKLTWFAPSLNAWATYTSENHAQKMVERMNEKTFNGRTLSASLQRPKSKVYRGTFSWTSDSKLSVKIKGLPLGTESAHLERFAQSRSVTIGDATYDHTIGIDRLKERLSQYGPLETFEPLPVSHKPKLSAFALFSSSDAAAKATKELHGTKEEFLGNNTLWVEHIHSIKYKIPWCQFMMVKNELDDLQSKHDGSKLLYYDRGQGGMEPVWIRIYSSDPKLLGRLKVDVEQVLSGQPLKCDGKDVWDPYFETQEGAEFVKQINSQSTIFVKCDTRTRTLCLYGDRGYAERLITQHLDEIIAGRHIIPLRKENIRGLLTGGLKTLTDEIGMDKVVLDVVALTLTIRGDDEDVRRAHRAVAAMDESSPTQFGADLEDLCPVCFCDPSDPVRLSCGHHYCSMCLKHLLRSRSLASAFSLIKCVADIESAGSTRNSSCDAFIPYSTIRDLLSPAEEANLFEASFMSHVHSRPKEFRYCPTPNCQVIYRHIDDENDSDGGTVLQCPSCLSRICAHCDVEFHEGLTCAQHVDNASGLEALRQWKAEHGVKSCPNCKADLEKIDGCNHITCGVCRTHMCWVCMATFPTSGEVYSHMRKAHGSIGLDYLQNMFG